MGFANAVEEVVEAEDEDENTGDNNNNRGFEAAECSIASDAAIERKLVGGECRKEPTYGLFLLAPSLLELIRTEVVCLRNVLLGAGHGTESCLRILKEEYFGLSMIAWCRYIGGNGSHCMKISLSFEQ
jgi:hypothetical protein